MEGTKIEETVPQPKAPAWGNKSWGSTPITPISSFQEVMSEELAKELQANDEKYSMGVNVDSTGGADGVDLTQFLETENTDNDLLLAQMLQHEFDKEHDLALSKEEKKYNHGSKVSVSFRNYRTVHPAIQDEEDSLDEDEFFVDKHRDVKDPQFNTRGISGKGKNMVTKHDSTLCGRKNTTRAMDKFGPDFEIGDGRSMDMKLPNHVYNKLKTHSQAQDKRGQRLHEKKEHATTEQAVDQNTRLIMYKLVNRGILEEVNGIISAGKESVVFHANGGRMDGCLVPQECALKVFKTTLSEFKNRCKYIKGDVRFFKDEFKKQNPRRIMKIWAAKEEFNLRRLEAGSVPCPRVIILKKHVLVMSFLGKDRVAAPKLKDAGLSDAEMALAYDQCIMYLKRMYSNCGLVHADLSEYNILWHNNTIHFIDVSQAVEKMHPLANEFLLRDCTNLVNFFSRHGVPNVPTQYELFNEVTGLKLTGEGETFLSQIEEYEKNEIKIREGRGKDYAFEYFFEKSQKDRQLVDESDSDNDSDDEEEEEGTESKVTSKTS